MSDNHSPEQRHRNMAAIHSASTKPEIKLRHALWQLGFRYKVNDKRLPGKPDIVLPKFRTVIFIHGCFWHGHKDCAYFITPKTNTEFWTAKIARNKEHDQVVWRQLEAKGWYVIIVWECELKKDRLMDTVCTVAAKIRDNGETHRQAMEDRREVRLQYQAERTLQKQRERQLNMELSEKFPD